MKNLLKKITTNRLESFLIMLLLAIAALAHSWNMFHFPYFENDEATYVSQAWSFIHEGKLTPYTYYYDHAPIGWMFLGLWFFLTGGLTTFGHNPLISARIFIFILHMFSVLFLYSITKRVTRQKLAASLAVIVFSLSPLELYFGRRVLLDNIMVFWVLLSLYFATNSARKLRDVLLSAVTFAIATLTKENALFLTPAILYIIWLYSQNRTKMWSCALWFAVAVLLLSLYPLYALLNGEFFQTGSLFGGTNNHVSLIQTTIMQSSRGTFSFPWEQQSNFYSSLHEWLTRDPWIIIGGGLCLLLSMILNERYREIKAIALTAIFEILFLARGKLIIDFYILAVIPLLAMTIGIMIARPLVWAKNHISPFGYSITICLLVGLIFVTSGTPAFSRDETTNQMNAVSWIEQHVSKNAYIAIDDYAYPQLHDVDGYQNADYEFKIQYDPAILSNKYHYDQYKIQYLLITHEEIVQMHSKQLPFIQKAFNDSQVVADYTNNTTSYIDLNKLISTNGDWAQVYKTEPKNAGLLVTSWISYKRNFIKDSGQVVDPPNGNSTSEAESYALIRSLEMNDKVEFDRVWNWTQNNLQKRSNDKLIASKVQIDNQGNNFLADNNPTSGPDEDIAFSLYEAYKKWGDTTYLYNAQAIIQDIWKKEVVNRNGQLYLVSIPNNPFENELLVNPSYQAPSEYKIFAKIDPEDNWEKLVNDSYNFLQKTQAQSKAGLFSNWVAVKQNGDLTSASQLGMPSPDVYGRDAVRISYRMTNDISDKRAQDILNKLNSFYESQWAKNGFIATAYDLDGNSLTYYNDIPTSAGAIISLSAMHQNLDYTLYQKDIMPTFNTNDSYWNQLTDYYSQNWAAFAVQYLGVGGHTIKTFPKTTAQKSVTKSQ